MIKVAVFLKCKYWIVITKINTEKVLNNGTVSGELVLYDNVDRISFSLTNGAGLSWVRVVLEPDSAGEIVHLELSRYPEKKKKIVV